MMIAQGARRGREIESAAAVLSPSGVIYPVNTAVHMYFIYICRSLGGIAVCDHQIDFKTRYLMYLSGHSKQEERLSSQWEELGWLVFVGKVSLRFFVISENNTCRVNYLLMGIYVSSSVALGSKCR